MYMLPDLFYNQQSILGKQRMMESTCFNRDGLLQDPISMHSFYTQISTQKGMLVERNTQQYVKIQMVKILMAKRDSLM